MLNHELCILRKDQLHYCPETRDRSEGLAQVHPREKTLASLLQTPTPSHSAEELIGLVIPFVHIEDKEERDIGNAVKMTFINFFT